MGALFLNEEDLDHSLLFFIALLASFENILFPDFFRDVKEFIDIDNIVAVLRPLQSKIGNVVMSSGYLVRFIFASEVLFVIS